MVPVILLIHQQMRLFLSAALLLSGFIQMLPAAKAESVTISPAATPHDSVAFYMELGRRDQQERKYSTAWRYYERAARYDGCNPETQLAIADVCLQMKRMGPAIKALDSAISLRQTDYATQWKLVQLYYYYDQSAKVIELLPALHKHYPDAKGWAYMLGRSYETQQDYGKGINYLLAAIKEEPDNAEALYHTGRMYMLMENYKTAIPYYKRTLALDSSNATRTYELALILSTVEQYDSSLSYFQKSIDRGYKPRDDFYMNMAYTLADAKQADRAINIVKGMLERRPGDLGMLNAVAEICSGAGYYEDAIGYWNKVLAIQPHDARTLYAIGTAYIKMGNKNYGEGLCNQAIAIEPALGVLKHARQMQM